MPEFHISPQRSYILEQFVNDLPAYRKKAKLRQHELAALVGISRQKMSDIERKTAPIGWDTFLAILFVLSRYGLEQEICGDTPLKRALDKELHPNT